MISTPTSGEVLEAVNDIAYSQEYKHQWDILAQATDEQLHEALANVPTTHIVSLIKRLIERGYLR